jgi:elongation factor P
VVLASQLRSGMVIRYEGQLYKLVSADYHPGQGKMGGATHARLTNLATGSAWEHSFRADLKIEELPVEKVPMEFLYADGGHCCFMNPETFEQMEIPVSTIGARAAFLVPQMQLSVEFVDGAPASVVFPDFVELAVEETAPVSHQQQDSTWKPARLQTGVEVMVPQFIKTGDTIRVDVNTVKYMDRVKSK